MKKYILLIILLLFSCNAEAGALGKFPMYEQLDKYCVGLRLEIDDDLHWFVINQLTFTDEIVRIKYGKRLDKSYVIPKEKVFNFEEAKEKHTRLLGEL